MWCWFDVFIQVEEMASNDQMMVAALGRPFTLGMLYDARKDELHTGKMRQQYLCI